MCSAWEAMWEQQQRQQPGGGGGGGWYCGPGRTVLIDDDAANVRAAREIGCSALWFDPSAGTLFVAARV